jgi:hypothetical protein
MIGLDMTPTSGGTASSAGVDTCVSVDRGETFEADVFATNIPNLVHFEFRVEFNPDVIALVPDAVDLNHFLAQDGGAAQFIQIDQDAPGRWFIGAADQSAPDSGSGTLARLTFEAVGNGASSVSIAAQPKAASPIVESVGPGYTQSFIGDDDGDSYWDGRLSSGRVAVGSSCSGSTPIVTPAPTTVPTPTPGSGPGTTPAPTNGNGGTDGGDNGSGDSDNGNDGGSEGDGGSGSGGDSGSDPEETPGSIVGNVDPGDDDSDTGNGPGSGQDPDDDEEGETVGGDNRNDDSGGSSTTLLVVLGLLAAVLGVASIGILAWMRANASKGY